MTMSGVEFYAAFVAATAALMLIPGPNVALITANSIAHGTRFGLMTVMGTTAAMIVQLALTACGMTALLSVLADLFDWLRWAGVGYLAYLGWRAWTAPAADLTQAPAAARSLRSIWLRGFLVSLGNPKTLLFYGAFLPQFIQAERPLWPQLLLLSMTCLVLASLIDSGWALLAGRTRHFFMQRGRLRNRLTGGLLLAAGCGLALARRR